MGEDEREEEGLEQEIDDEDEEGGEGGGAAAKSGGGIIGPGIFKILKIVGAILGIIIVTVLVSFFVAKSVAPSGTATAPQGHGDQMKRQPPMTPWPMKEMIINTADEEESHIIKCEIVLAHGLEDQKTMTDLNSRRYEIRDAIRSIIGSKKYSEINSTVEQNNLKKEIMKALKQILSKDCKVTAVYYNSFSVH